MRLPAQTTRMQMMPAADVRPSAEGTGIRPSGCCDGTVTIYSPSGATLYQGPSSCCYDAGASWCYPCSNMRQHWEDYAKDHFSACTGSTTCAVALDGCGHLRPYC